MLHRITLLAIAAPRRLLGVAALVMVAAAVFGVPVAKSLSAGGFQDPSAESSRAMRLLTDKFGQGDVQLMFLVTAPGGAGGSSARAAGREIVDLLHNAPYVVDVVSAWTGLRRRCRPGQQGRPVRIGCRGDIRRRDAGPSARAASGRRGVAVGAARPR